MPVTASPDALSAIIKPALIGGAGVATAATLLFLGLDPTAGANDRLNAIDPVLSRAPMADAGKSARVDVARMASAPLFVMTTGAAAYKEKTFQLYGVSISPKRRAALVSIDGAPATWITVGDVSGDVRLADIGTNGASFETPVGTRTVTLSDPPPAAGETGTAQ